MSLFLKILIQHDSLPLNLFSVGDPLQYIGAPIYDGESGRVYNFRGRSLISHTSHLHIIQKSATCLTQHGNLAEGIDASESEGEGEGEGDMLLWWFLSKLTVVSNSMRRRRRRRRPRLNLVMCDGRASGENIPAAGDLGPGMRDVMTRGRQQLDLVQLFQLGLLFFFWS